MPEIEFIYRRAEPRDASDIKQIESECRLSPWNIEDYRREAEINPEFIVCEYQKKIVGFILARLITNFNYNYNPRNINSLQRKEIHLNLKDENECIDFEIVENIEAEFEIFNIGVLKEFRRRRIGTHFLVSVIDKAAEYDKYAIILDVRASNTSAVEFYERHGFEIVSKRTNLYTNPLEDGWFMKLENK